VVSDLTAYATVNIGVTHDWQQPDIPIEKPTTAYSPSLFKSMSRDCRRATWARTLSEYVTCGKSFPEYGEGVLDGEED
jgi:hypothetical protein